MSKPKVMIGIPSLGATVSSGTLASICSAVSSKSCQVVVFCQGLSLLARNFNAIFARAIQGEYDYLVIHHSDLRAMDETRPWIDTLVDQMRSLDVAVISAAVPIKNLDGHFSMGLALNRSAWPPVRRVTATELARLPGSFITRENLCELFGTNPSCAGAMLVNTGLMLMDLRNYDWAAYNWPGFNIADRIAWNKVSQPHLYTVPEDWGFSLWMHEHGIPYVATRQIVVEHYGSASYVSSHVWGHECDHSAPEMSPEQWEQADE